jgi:hypothetical protein
LATLPSREGCACHPAPRNQRPETGRAPPAPAFAPRRAPPSRADVPCIARIVRTAPRTAPTPSSKRHVLATCPNAASTRAVAAPPAVALSLSDRGSHANAVGVNARANTKAGLAPSTTSVSLFARGVSFSPADGAGSSNESGRFVVEKQRSAAGFAIYASGAMDGGSRLTEVLGWVHQAACLHWCRGSGRPVVWVVGSPPPRHGGFVHD